MAYVTSFYGQSTIVTSTIVQSTTVIIVSSIGVAGPLTTLFTPPASCSALCLLPHDPTGPWMGRTCSHVGNDYAGCLPPSTPPSFFMMTHVYSPGICPSSHTPACSLSNLKLAPTPPQAALCCPLGFNCDSLSMRCFRRDGLTSTAGVTILSSSSIDVVSETVDSFIPESVLYSGIAVAWQSTDTAVAAIMASATQSSSSNNLTTTSTPTASSTPSLPTSTNTSPNPLSTRTSQNLSTGARAGIGVGAAIAGLLILIALVLYVKRLKRQIRLAKNDNLLTGKPELSAQENEKRVQEPVEMAAEAPAVYEMPVEEGCLELGLEDGDGVERRTSRS